jgi:nicotinate-nucleotide adenylyltransferase
MKAAIIGGTFNPIHIGHLFVAEEVLNELNYEKIIFIPANIPPHKTIAVKINVQQRIKMIKYALKPYKNYIYDECEIDRGGISYTVDTVDYIKKKYKIEKLGYILGDDLVKEFYTWKNATELSERADLIVVHRLYKEELDFKYKHKYINNYILRISSSEIRSRIASGKSVRFLLTKDVFNYININKLYK